MDENKRTANCLRSCWVGYFLLLLSSSVAVAQLPTATISGVARDPSGALMPGVSLTATNTQTGLSRTTTTAENGSYRFPALPVGIYDVRAEYPGFQTKVQAGLHITVGQEAVLHFTMDIGAVTETVSVTAESPIVNTTSGSLSSLVSEQRVADLPLDGRNYNDLTLLQTGVAESRNTQTGSTQISGTAFSSNGAPIRSNMFMIDGTIMNDASSSGAGSVSDTTLGVEGIKEFRVVTNSFSAEYGILMGSQVTLVTKSGTNQLHGSLFEYLRNSALDARQWNDYSEKKPGFRRNNFGGAVGGPLQRDRLFYFLTYEGLVQGRGVSFSGSVPTAAARVDGGLVPVIAPSVRPYLALYPLPNGPDQGQGAGRYFASDTRVQHQHFGQGRGDYNPSDSSSLFLRYTIDDADEFAPSINPVISTSLHSVNKWMTVSENHIFTPMLLNTARASYSRTKLVTVESAICGTGLDFVPGKCIGGLNTGISGGGFTQGTQAPGQTANQRIASLTDDVFYTHGGHALKFGTMFNSYRQYVYGGDAVRGNFTFGNLVGFLQAQPIAFEVLTPGSKQERTFDFEIIAFYLQDDWRVTPTFTLNLGLRYEFMTQMEEIRGNGAMIRDLLKDATGTRGILFENPSRKNFSPRLGFAWDIFGNGGTALRGGFGLLYDLGTFTLALRSASSANPPVSTRTALEANDLVGRFGPNVQVPAGREGRDLSQIDFHLQQPHMLSYNLTLERQLPWSTGLTIAYAGSRGINLLQRKEGNPRFPGGVPQIVNGQRVCLAGTSPAFDPAGGYCWLGTTGSAPVGTDPRLNRNFDSVEYLTAGSNSFYNSLQIGVNKRVTQGLQFQSSYTWSHAVDDTQGTAGAEDQGQRVEGDNPFNRLQDRGPSTFDLRHNWRFNAIYRLPLNVAGGWGKLMNGWWTSTILTWNTGTYFTTLTNVQRSRSGVLAQAGGQKRLDLVPGVKAEDVTRGVSRGCGGVPAGSQLGTPQLFYDPCAFVNQPLGFIGNGGRAILRGPNFSNVSFSLVKDTALGFLGENGRLQFRTEIFNLFNHPSLNLPDRTAYTGTADVQNPRSSAGDITSTRSLSREVQFALKILF